MSNPNKKIPYNPADYVFASAFLSQAMSKEEQDAVFAEFYSGEPDVAYTDAEIDEMERLDNARHRTPHEL
jgi:hypothetical protein